MPRVTAILAGVAASTAGFVLLRDACWGRAERVAASVRRLQADIPNSVAVAPVQRPGLPVVDDPELGARVSAFSRHAWNAAVLSVRSAALMSLSAAASLMDTSESRKKNSFPDADKKAR